MIYCNAKIYCGSGEYAEALLEQNGRIVEVGSTEDIIALAPQEPRRDLGGRLMLPGFHDSHMHFINRGYRMQQLDISATANIDEAVALACKELESKSLSEGQWLQLYGWNDDNWSDRRFINRYDLDRVSRTVPIIATRICEHICAVNSRALELLGIAADTELQGVYRDENGEPTGVLSELIPFINDRMAEPSVEEIKEIILAAGELAASRGLTAVQTDDFGSLPGQNMQRIVQAYTELSEEGRMPVRVYEQCRLMNMQDVDRFEKLGFTPGAGSEFFRLGPLKTFCDGSLGARTAWLREEYSDDPGNCGTRIYENTRELEELIERVHCAGMSSAIHCIGDAAAYQAVGVIETVMKKHPGQNVRHGIVHAQVLSDELMERIAAAGIIAYIQPIFLEYDLHMAEKRLGAQRLECSYHYRRLYDSGVCIPFGTDCPVEDLSPLANIYCAVNGMDLNGQPREGWHREKLLTVRESVRCCTEFPAWASFSECDNGKLSKGMRADFVVTERSIFDIDPCEIKDAGIYLTVMGGKVTFDSQNK